MRPNEDSPSQVSHPSTTYIEYRAVSGIFRTIDPPPPLHSASVSSSRTNEGGEHTRRAVRGWGVNISEAARHWIGLLQYNPSTHPSQRKSVKSRHGPPCRRTVVLHFHCTVYSRGGGLPSENLIFYLISSFSFNPQFTPYYFTWIIY